MTDGKGLVTHPMDHHTLAGFDFRQIRREIHVRELQCLAHVLYVLFQFIIILVASTTFLVFQGKSPINDSLGLKVGLAGLIVFSLLNIGGIFEKKRWVLAFEYARIVILAAVIIVLLNHETLSNALGISTIVVSLISLVWFSFYLGEFKSQTPVSEFKTQTSSYV